MKLVAVESGQTLQLVIAEQVRPQHGVHAPTFLRAIAERYQFAIVPNIAESVENQISKFRNGRLPSNKDIIIRNLDMYTDGVVAIAFDTPTSDATIDDFSSFLVSEFKFRVPTTPLRRIHLSAAIVEFERPFNAALAQFGQISALAAKAIEEASGRQVSPMLATLRLQADPTTLPQHTNTEFIIERRANRPFNENTFFSSAPLTTQAHLDWLASVERLFG